MESDEDPENYTSPRPMPKFYHEQDTFSTKKSKLALGLRIGTPLDCAPPRPPVKSAPPVSRIFPHRRVIGPQPVSFRKAHSLDSVCYNHSLKLSYFEQCFIILEKIGHGSFGEVFKVQSREDGQLYAVKKTQEKFRSESDRRRKLEEVAKYEMLMEHKNVVKFYRAWEEDRILYIQMELCELSLSQYALMHHTIPEMTIWCFLIDLLFGVKHLHDNNLVHMDIKPENVFISSQNYCKLGDLGLVIDLSKKKDHSEGTEGDAKYLAPELMAGHFGKPADIFSLGITIMELASDLDVPKGGEKWHELRQGGLPTQFMTSRSSTLRSVIAQMLEPDFTKRPTVDQILAMSSMRKYLKSRIYHYQMINVTRGSTVTQANLAKLQSRANTSTMDDDGAPGVDISISDEEMQDDSLAGNSMTVHPLDESRADDEVDGMFLMPLPHRQVVTEPVIRYRAMLPSPISSSPVSARKKRSDCPASPVDGAGVNHSFESEKSITPPRPRVLFPDDYEDEEDKLSKIEPKNLMEAFNTAVEDEDISL